MYPRREGVLLVVLRGQGRVVQQKLLKEIPDRVFFYIHLIRE